MDFDVHSWLEILLQELKNAFSSRLVFVGMQGSYARGEQHENSDIDVVIILDTLSLDDLSVYKKIIKTMPYNKKVCGFVSGVGEIKNWPKHDVFQLLFDTLPFYGNLMDLDFNINVDDAKRAVKYGASNLYHMTVHSFLFDKDCKKTIKLLYKNIFFILQAQYFYKNSVFIKTKKELYNKLNGSDKKVFDILMNPDSFCNPDIQKTQYLYEKLINWCSEKIKEY